MILRWFEGWVYSGPGCSARPATSRLRRACEGAHSRTAVDPSDPALHPLAPVRQGFSPQRSIDSFREWNLTQNRRKFFHLICVPRHLPPLYHLPHSDYRCLVVLKFYKGTAD